MMYNYSHFRIYIFGYSYFCVFLEDKISSGKEIFLQFSFYHYTGKAGQAANHHRKGYCLQKCRTVGGINGVVWERFCVVFIYYTLFPSIENYFFCEWVYNVQTLKLLLYIHHHIQVDHFSNYKVHCSESTFEKRRLFLKKIFWLEH